MASKTKGWRAVTGTCGKPGAIEVTTNGGRSWQEVRKSGLSVITGLEAQDSDTVVATGGDKDCAVRSAISNNSGEDWNRSDMAGSTWYLTPRNRKVVRAPGGDRSEPCEREAIALAVSTERRAAVLCENGLLHTSKNGGSSWRATGGTAGVAIGGDDDGYVVANLKGPCDGITVTRFDAEGKAASGKSVPCAPATTADPKRLAIARFRETVWIWHDDIVTVASDGTDRWDTL